jgi:hypothetical protein
VSSAINQVPVITPALGWVASCAYEFFPALAGTMTIFRKKPAMRNEAKTVKKAQCDITRGCWHVRQLASAKKRKNQC